MRKRLPGRKDLHDAASPFQFAIGALLHVVGAKAPVVGIGKIQVGQGVRLGLFQERRRFGAKARDPLAGQVVGLADESRVAL